VANFAVILSDCDSGMSRSQATRLQFYFFL